MGERSSDLAGHCNALTYGCVKCSGYASQCVDGHYHIENSKCCCKYGTTTGSIIPSRQRNVRRRHAFNRAACSLFLTEMSQTLVPVAFLSKRPNLQLKRNLLLRDEVALRGVPDLGQSATFPVC